MSAHGEASGFQPMQSCLCLKVKCIREEPTQPALQNNMISLRNINRYHTVPFCLHFPSSQCLPLHSSLIDSAPIFSTLPFSALRLCNHFYSLIRFASLLFWSLLCIHVYPLFYCSLIEKPSPVGVFIFRRIWYSKNMRAPGPSIMGKSMPHTIDSFSKYDMYIMDFPTAHRLRHKKTSAAQVTTLTLYLFNLFWFHDHKKRCSIRFYILISWANKNSSMRFYMLISW